MVRDSIYEWELGLSDADLVSVTGELELPDEGWILKLLDDGAVTVGSDLVLFTYGSLADDSLGLCNIDTNEVSNWIFSDGGPELHYDPINNCVMLTGVVAVPEPGTLVLLMVGGLCLAALGWKGSC